jgi:hypothetical protein
MGWGRTFFAPRVKAKSCFPARRESAAAEYQGPEEVEAPLAEGGGPAHSAQGEFFMAVSGKLFCSEDEMQAPRLYAALHKDRALKSPAEGCVRYDRRALRDQRPDVCQPIGAKHRSRLRPSRYRETGSC